MNGVYFASEAPFLPIWQLSHLAALPGHCRSTLLSQQWTQRPRCARCKAVAGLRGPVGTICTTQSSFSRRTMSGPSFPALTICPG